MSLAQELRAMTKDEEVEEGPQGVLDQTEARTAGGRYQAQETNGLRIFLLSHDRREAAASVLGRPKMSLKLMAKPGQRSQTTRWKRRCALSALRKWFTIRSHLAIIGPATSALCD